MVVEYEHMTWQEVQAAAEGGMPVVLAVGSTEQHGPALPVSADWVLPLGLLQKASDRSPFVIGPPIRFGYRSRPGSGGGQGFLGTISLRAVTFMAMIEDILEELVRSRFHRIALMNWHYENAGFVYEPAVLVSSRHPDVHLVVIEQPFPEFSRQDLDALFPDGFPGLDLEHAAMMETSLYQYLLPDEVRDQLICDDSPERHPPYDVLPIDPTMTTRSGVLAPTATSSSPAKGELIAERVIDHIIGILQQEFGKVAATPTLTA
jgi:creatinine amidohydrolase